MPQYQVFGFQPLSRLEAVAQHPDEEEANCDHQSQSCSDSLAAVTPADGVFGSDRGSLYRRMNVPGELIHGPWPLSISARMGIVSSNVSKMSSTNCTSIK